MDLKYFCNKIDNLDEHWSVPEDLLQEIKDNLSNDDILALHYYCVRKQDQLIAEDIIGLIYYSTNKENYDPCNMRNTDIFDTKLNLISDKIHQDITLKEAIESFPKLGNVQDIIDLMDLILFLEETRWFMGDDILEKYMNNLIQHNQLINAVHNKLAFGEVLTCMMYMHKEGSLFLELKQKFPEEYDKEINRYLDNLNRGINNGFDKKFLEALLNINLS